MFERPWGERLSRIPPWVPYVLWSPVLVGLVWTRPWNLAGFLVGVVGWTAFEYALHRWVLHAAFPARLHFLIHGVHHADPLDAERLVMPWPGVVSFLAILPVMVFLAGGAFTAGFLAGYLLYEATHYSIHHRRPRTAWGRRVAAHHLAHHGAETRGHWGISSPLWDWVVRG